MRDPAGAAAVNCFYANGRLFHAVDRIGRLNEYTHDGAGRVIEKRLLCLPNIRIFRRRASIMHIVACMVDFQNFDHNRATNFVASPASLDIDCE